MRGTIGPEGDNMNLGIPELIIILAIVILIFGANRLPEIGRGIGRGIRNFKDATKDGSQTSQPTEKS
jgi:sec-independent protein translocase protein TatA